MNFVVHITIDNFLIMKNIYDQKISSPKEFNHSKISFISLIRANLLCTVSTHRLFLRDTRRNRTIDINRFLDLLFPEEQSMLVDRRTRQTILRNLKIIIKECSLFELTRDLNQLCASIVLPGVTAIACSKTQKKTQNYKTEAAVVK